MQGFLFTTYVCLGSLVAVTGLNQFIFSPADSNTENLIWFGIQILPLILPLAGTLAGSIRATFFLCMASLLYFIHGVILCFEPDLLLLGGIEIAFALGLCAVTAILVRRLREAEAAE